MTASTLLSMRKPRRVEADAEIAVQEGLAADIALLRAVAIEQAINAGEEIIAAAIAGLAFHAELAGMHAGELDA